MADRNNKNPIPSHAVGVGLKPAHYRDALSPIGVRERAGGVVSYISFFEAHAENYMGAGGPPHAWLTAVREQYPLSLHGVCLSLGGFDNLDKDHLERLRIVVDRYDPALVSEHLAWSSHDGVFFNDLIAPPATKETLARTINHIDQLQTTLRRPILVENPSQYVEVPSDVSEPDFLNELARGSGCRLLLDINNVFVSACNLGFDAAAYINAIDPALVEEIHLAGHTVDTASGVEIRVDDHGSPVCDDVGSLYRGFITKAGPRPTLVEWDTDTPDLATLNLEAGKAAEWMSRALSGNPPPRN